MARSLRWGGWAALAIASLLLPLSPRLLGEPPKGLAWKPPACEIVPMAGRQVSMRIDGIERCRWHHDPSYPRPFFFPLIGPSGEPLTRMGHPGAENHDHHRSVWFAFNNVAGLDFWGDRSGTQVVQDHWYAYRSEDAEGMLAARLLWLDAGGVATMESDAFAAIVPMDDGEYGLELQLDLRPAAGREEVELGKTNFGFLAVRVAESISAHFGGGQLTNSEGAIGEPAIFAKRAKWVDYSGPVAVGNGPDRKVVVEGITFFDHPDNPRHPTHWHVREDGWMGAAFCLEEGYRVTKGEGLRLRYLLHVHRGGVNGDAAAAALEAFAKRPPMRVRKGKTEEKHRQYVVERSPPSERQ